jgi:hypothetical protein
MSPQQLYTIYLLYLNYRLQINGVYKKKCSLLLFVKAGYGVTPRNQQPGVSRLTDNSVSLCNVISAHITSIKVVCRAKS